MSLLGLILLASPVHADSQLAVATFDDQRPEQPGTTVTRSLRVSNVGDDQMTVRIQPRGVELLDDGQTQLRDQEDPRWAGLVRVATPELSLAARSSREVQLSITIPNDVGPDEYILGVVVSPELSGSGTHLINEIGALVPISVAGDRVRRLELVDHSLPGFVIGDSVSGTVRVRNTGTTLVSAWNEAAVDDALTGDQRATIQVLGQTRVAPGTSRDLSYTWDAGIAAGKFRIPVRVSYNQTNATTTQLDFEDEVWLIHPFVLAAGIGLLGVLLVWGARAFVVARRRMAHPSPVVAEMPAV